MEVTNSLLVAMMYIMVLSIGIANILMGVSALVDHRNELPVHWLPITWLLLTLLEHLDLFWHTLHILDVEEWRFGGFLYVVTGPILLLLATNLVLPTAPSEPEGSHWDRYFAVSRQFFGLLTLLMLWLIGIDFVLGAGFSPDSFWNVVSALLLATLTASRSRSLHVGGAAIAIALTLGMLGMRAVV